MTELFNKTPSADGAARGYTVLARRYRSTSFDEIVGQEAIARTLQNAIERGRTAHAYLFCGTRGVGKTSMARIFAKALNVSQAQKEKDAIGQAILRGDDIDVIEIDGASNRGIDEVRDLIANAGLTPARSPYKIYIIDEVHMLTPPAFNALLKIMEEPPAHVKFILCTTDPQKVPATIQSRCQRFDFRAIPASKIASHLRDVLKQETIRAEEAAITEVARQANGSMRDALSLTDRLIAAGSGALTIEVIATTLGAPDHALVSRLADAMLSGDPAATLEAGAELLAFGTSPEQALEVLVEHLRNVMVVAACGKDSPLFELFGEAREAAERHAALVDVAGVVHMIALCEGTSKAIKGSSTPRAVFDALLVRLALTDQLASIPALLQGTVAPAAQEKKKNPRAEVKPLQGVVQTGGSRRSGQQPAALIPVAARTTESKPVRGSTPAPGGSDPSSAAAHPLVARAVELLNATIVGVRAASNQPASLTDKETDVQ